MELKRKDDVVFILTELADEALGLAELGKRETCAKMRDSEYQNSWPRRAEPCRGEAKQ